jgi:hypothetical protein
MPAATYGEFRVVLRRAGFQTEFFALLREA